MADDLIESCASSSPARRIACASGVMAEFFADAAVYTRGPGRVALHACGEILVILVAMRGNTCVDLRALPSPVEPAIQAAMRIAGPGIGQDIHGRDGAIRARTLYPAAVFAVGAMFHSTPE